MTYEEQLKDFRWAQKKKYILVRDGFTCQTCFRKENLQVHHLCYVDDGRMAWQYPDDDLITLCEGCHKNWHIKHGIVKRAPDFIRDGFARVRDDLRLLAALIRKSGA